MTDPNQQPATDRLRRIELVTEPSLGHLDVEELLDELLERVRELLDVDTAAVLLLDPSGSELVATAAHGIEEEVQQGVRVPLGRGFAGRIAADKRPVVIERVDHTNVINPLLRDRGIQSLLGVPLLSAGSVLGVMHVGTLRQRTFTEDDVQLLQLVAERVTVATQSRRSAIEHSAARALQRSLLPGALPSIPGVSIAARYVAGEAAGLGGDWYDAFPLPSGGLFLVIGDVVGRGLRAAVVMGRLRSTVRAYALTDPDPARVLSLLDQKIQYFEPGEMATVLVAIFHPTLDKVEISCAGHPPPVLAPPDAPAGLVDLAVDPPIGVRPALVRRSTTIEIPDGAVMCFYTDGLVERRGVDIDERFAQLCASVFADEADSVCTAVMRSLVGSESASDDIALIALRVRGDEGQAALDIHVPAVPASLTHIRTALRRWLVNASVTSDDATDILLALGEATANAVEHAYGPGRGTVSVHVALDGSDVLATVSDVGRWRPARGENRGRGTTIMKECMDDVDVRSDASGTTVTMRRRVEQVQR